MSVSSTLSSALTVVGFRIPTSTLVLVSLPSGDTSVALWKVSSTELSTVWSDVDKDLAVAIRTSNSSILLLKELNFPACSPSTLSKLATSSCLFIMIEPT